ncbi:sulfotransferase domain-containing protein [Sphingopyxis sp. XHP0097]|uniref:Sulfotransferase domain-containing protein n=1 Tax=Sphingopyxis jiangsuensis TaxID=2871171 RepID=A0ABS7MIY9_9SPHN|nr:sulfotransferase domain-containing protein [Sphingopyxis jiangsuensis]MBY4638041.1 sulfotransferase domain-containing protein [Sphingopyxis jiangsuensis]
MFDTPQYPRKTREFHNHHMDSTIWNRFAFRPDDVIVSTYAKSGTTWTQQIVGQILFQGDPDVRVADISPWLDLRLPTEEEKFALLDAQTHRRFIKTHLPLDAFVYRPEIKHIYIARDGRDIAWSMFNHASNFVPEFYDILNSVPGRVGPPLEHPEADVVAFFRRWLDQDGAPFWSLWENVRTWWEGRHLPNMLMLHFADMKRDLPGTIRKVAAFLEVELSDEAFERAVLHSSFDWMKANAEKAAPLGGTIFQGGAATFINKGSNGRWQELLTDADVAAYEARALAELGAECAGWLAGGGEIAPPQAAAA